MTIKSYLEYNIALMDLENIFGTDNPKVDSLMAEIEEYDGRKVIIHDEILVEPPLDTYNPYSDVSLLEQDFSNIKRVVLPELSSYKPKWLNDQAPTKGYLARALTFDMEIPLGKKS